nr:unnamed protein product [Digitaria exilis]
MYGSGSGCDDDVAPPSPPLGTALADATADIGQRRRNAGGGRGGDRRIQFLSTLNSGGGSVTLSRDDSSTAREWRRESQPRLRS